MGLGDDIMASAEARRIASTGKLAYMGPNWSEVWENNPHITQDKAKGVLVSNRIGQRPYIAGVTAANIIYREDHRAEPGGIFLTDNERKWAVEQISGPFIIVEPHIKGSFSGNKAWIWDRWQEVANKLPLPVVQIGLPHKRGLNGATRVKTGTFRKALALLDRASLLITTDGALHHAAAALNVPAVVLWGARTHPSILGYEAHENIYTGSGESCGAMAPCKHCVDAMKRITVDMVLDSARRALEARQNVVAAE